MTRRLASDRSGATAVEFALVLPLLLILIFGVIDGGRFMWEFNRAEKATAVGARVAVVTNVIPSGLATATYVGVGGLAQGDSIPASALDTLQCSNPSGTLTCACIPSGGNCPAVGALNSTDFDRIVTRMRFMKPDITAKNVVVEYRGSGLGYAGDPNGMEIAPLVTVRLTGLQFKPLTGLMLATLNLPAFFTTLTAEDSSGVQSN